MIAGLIVRIIGFFYRIYLSNLIGAEGMGLFSLISPVYSLVITVLTAGMAVAVPRLVAREYAVKHDINPPRITKVAFVMLVSAGVLVSVLLYFNLNFVANKILKDSRTYYSMLFLLPCIPVITGGTAIRGYFLGRQDMMPSSVSMVIEQLAKITLVFLSAGYFMKLGLEYACALAVAGMAVGEILNFLVVLIIYKARRVGKKGFTKAGLLRKRDIAGELIKTSAPISANRFLTSLLYSAENILIPQMLLLSGLNYKSSIETYGMLMGMAMPIIFFPSIVTGSLATAMIPAVSEAVSIRNFRLANSRIAKAIQLSFAVGFLFAALFYTYPGQLSDLLYKDIDIGSILKLMSVTCIFMYLSQTLSGILNGLGKQSANVRNSAVGKVIRIIFVLLLIPKIGIDGYMYGLMVSYFITAILDLKVVIKTTGMSADLRNWILKPGIVGFAMFLAGKYIIYFFGIFIKRYDLLAAASIFGTILIGFALMSLTGALDIKGLLGKKKKKFKSV